MQPTASQEGLPPVAVPPPTEVVAPAVTNGFGNPAVAAPAEMPPLPDGHVIQGAPVAGMPPASPDPSIYASKDTYGAEARAAAWGAPTTGLTTDGTMTPGSEPVVTPSPIVTEPQPIPTPEPIGGMPSSEPVQPDLSAIPSSTPAETTTPAPLPTTPQETMAQTAAPQPTQAAEASQIPTVDISTIKETDTDQEILKAAADASSAIKLVEEEELRRGVGDAFARRLAYIWGVPENGAQEKIH